MMVLCVFALLFAGCTSSAKVTISFDTLGGPRVSSMTVTSATESLELPEPRARTGYTFDYWCYDDTCTQRVDLSVVPTEDTVFYAKWTRQRVAVTFVADGNKQYKFVQYGDDLLVKDMPAVPEKEGYDGRWNTGDLTNVTAGVTINAIYTTATYAVTYMLRNEAYYTAEGEPGAVAAVPDDPTVSGAVFLGWYFDVDFFLPCLDPVNTFGTSDVVLYGRLISTEGMERYFTFSYGTESAAVTGLTVEGKRENVLVVPATVNDLPVVRIAAGTQESPTVRSDVLTNLILPNSLTEIGAYAFSGNAVLNELRLSEGVETIGENAFSGLTSLTEITLPASVKVLSDYALSGCTALETAVFATGSALETLGESVFSGCNALHSFRLPDSSADFFSRASLYGSVLTELTSVADRYVAVEGVLYSADGTVALACAPKRASSVEIAEGCVEIADNAFRGCDVLTGVTLASTVESIGKHAFDACASLENLIFASQGSLTTLDEYAFASSGLTSLTVPATVREINARAFYDCDALAFVDLSAITAEELGEYAFSDNDALAAVNLGAIRAIGEYAFYGCSALTQVSFPTSTLQNIGAYAFADCPALRNETLPSTLQTIGDYAFAGITAHSTAEISIPRPVVSIGDYAFMNTDTRVFQPNATALTHLGVGVFKNCARLTRANLPQTAVIDALPDEFFYGCSVLSSVTIPTNIVSLGDYAFYGCSSLLTVTFNAGGTGVTTIGESCFENCVSLVNNGNLTRILPTSVTTLGEKAFKNCSALREITIPKNVKTIAKEAFSRCSALQTVLYEDDCLTDTLAEECFAYCTSLTSFRLPEKLALRGVVNGESVGAVKNPFLGCTSLASLSVNVGNERFTVDDGVVYVADGGYRKIYLYPTGRGGEFSVENDVSEIDDYAFYGARLSLLTFNSYPIVEGVENIVFVKIGDYAFARSALTGANLTKRVYSIGEGAFYNSSLASVTLDGNYVASGDAAYNILNTGENNLLTVGKNAFSLTGLTSLTIPARTQKIDQGAFADCYSLRSVTFAQGTLTGLTLEADAFRRDGYLTTLTFPTQLIKIGDYAFADCNNVADVTFLSTSLFTVGDYAFKSNHYLYSLNLPSTLTSVGAGAFSDCTRLTDVTVSESGGDFVLSDRLFFGDGSLKTFTVPARVHTIGKYAFVGTKLESLRFDDAIALGETLVIDDYAFYRLTTLKDVDFPSDLVSIGEYAFAESGLTGFTYGDGALSIEGYAFFNTPLRSVELKSGVTMAGTHIFAGTSDLVSLAVGATRAHIADYAFYESGLSEIEPFVAESIGEYAFASCANLTSAEVSFLPVDLGVSETFIATIGAHAYDRSGLTGFVYETTSDVVVRVGDSAFARCDDLLTVTLSVSAFSIGENAFADSGLTALRLSGEAENIGEGFARNTAALTGISVSDTSGTYASEDGVIYRSDAGNVVLLQYPAGKAGSSLYLNASVTEIADYAFDGNAVLNTLVVNGTTPVIANEHSFGSRTDIVAYVPNEDLSGYADWTIRVERYSQNVNGLILSWIKEDEYEVTDYVGAADTVVIPGIVNVARDGKTVALRIERIAEKAFFNKINVRSVVIRNGIREIGAYAFAGCTNLENVTFGNNVTTVKEYAFYGCSALTELTLNDDLSSVGRYAFAFCRNLTTATLSESLTALDAYAFAECSSLTAVTFGRKLKTIGDNAFENADSLITLRFPDALNYVGNYAFRGCDQLTFIYLSSTSAPTLKSIDAFGATSPGLKLFVPSASEKFYRSDPQWRYYTENIIGVIDFDDWMLDDTPFVYDDYVLKMVPLSGNDQDPFHFRLLAYLGTEEDYVMPGSNDAYIEAYVTEIGEYAFGAFTRTIVLGEHVKLIDKNAFRNASELVSVTLTPGVETIGDYAFYGLKNLRSVIFASGATPALTTIGNYAFYDCDGLTTFALPARLTAIGNYAFSGPEMHLTGVTSSAPASVSLKIGAYAFANNVDLSELSFACAISSIGNGAFSYCTSLGSLYFNSMSSSAPVIAAADTLVFEACDLLAIFVPTDDIRRNYLQTWQNQFDRYRIYVTRNITESYDDNGSHVEQDGFVISTSGGGSTASIVAYVGSETDVVFPSTVRLRGVDLTVIKIGREENNSALVSNGRVISDAVTRVTIPGTVATIAGDAFRGAKGLTEVVVENGDSATAVIGNYAFADCVNLTTVTLSYNVTSIGQYAFANDGKLTSFHVNEYPASAVDKQALTVGVRAFENCVAMETISFPKHLGTLGNYVFNGASNLATVDFGEGSSLTSIGQYCFAYSGLVTITMPGTVTNVGDNAFAYCASLSSVHLTRTTAEYNSLTTTSDNVFRGVNSVFVKVYVPEGNFAQYENASGWSRKTVIPDLREGDYNYRRAGAAGAVILTAYLGSEKHVEIPSTITVDGVNLTVTTLHSYFGNATVEEFSFRDDCQITNFNNYAFAGCASLRRIHLPAHLKGMGDYCFANCVNLTDVKLSEEMDALTGYAFYGCSSLQEIYIPASAGEVGMAAFLNCTSLIRVEIGFSQASSLGLSAFVNTNEKLVIVVPENRQDAFSNEWSDHASIIYDRKYLFGDFVVKDDGNNGYILVQYTGGSDLDFDTLTINGRRVSMAE